jgi:plasmid stability protein
MEPLWLRAMPSLTLKDLPNKLHRKLKNRAKAHHRSLNKEVIATLQNATAATRAFDQDALEESIRRARSLFRRPVTAREIDAWKRAGRM